MKSTLTPPSISNQTIAFIDLVGYHRNTCARLTPGEVFEFIAEYYSILHACKGSDARIVKFMGDYAWSQQPTTHRRTHWIGRRLTHKKRAEISLRSRK